MSRAVAGWVLVLVVPSLACSAVTDVVTTAPTKTTFKAVWINANWNGGRTGTPLRSQAETPPTGVGLLCPAESLLLENHVSYGPFDPTGLWITNNCNQAIFEVAVCLTAGSFGTASSIRRCAVDPRETLASNLEIHRIGAGSHDPYNDTSIDLDISVFFCSQGSHMNLGEVQGISPTDCVED